MLNDGQDRTFNEKLQYFKGFFANKSTHRQPKTAIPQCPSEDTVNEMYKQLLKHRGVTGMLIVTITALEGQYIDFATCS